MTNWFNTLSSGIAKSDSVTTSKLEPVKQFLNPRKVTIPLGEQKWVPQTINAADYTSVSGLRKHYPMSDYSLQTLPKDLIESNGGAGEVFIGGKEIKLDELTMFHSRTGNSYGAIGIKHTANGDEIYIHECKDGYNITSKYVNGELKNVEKVSVNSSSHSGIMPWA